MSVIGFVGLGAMGGRMARRLLDAGHELVAWNRSPARSEQLAALGATVADTPADAARTADVVITIVSDPDALRAVTEGPTGIASGVGTGVGTAVDAEVGAGARGAAPPTVVEMSTVGPAAIRRLASVLPTGVNLLDAPVLGSLTEAEAGRLHIFVGGTAELAQRWTPVLSTLGTPLHVGPLGSGAAAKLVANSTLFGMLGVLGEALALADGLGLSRAVAFDVLATTPVAGQAARRRPVLESGAYPLRFPLSLARKDADLVLDAATTAGVDVRVAAAVRSWLADAEEAGFANQDYSAVLAAILDAARSSAPQ